MTPLLLAYLPLLATASFFGFRSPNSTFLQDLGTIDSYIFPLDPHVSEEVLRAANSTDLHLTAYATSLLDAALYFRTHPTLLSALAASVMNVGRDQIRAAQCAAFAQFRQLVGPSTHLGELIADYSNIITGTATFSPFVREAVVMELIKLLREPRFRTRFEGRLRKIELEYERRMMDVMLKGTAGSRELQTPFLMMAAGMKLVHERVGLADRIPQGWSPQGSKLNATMPHNEVEAGLMPQ